MYLKHVHVWQLFCKEDGLKCDKALFESGPLPDLKGRTLETANQDVRFAQFGSAFIIKWSLIPTTLLNKCLIGDTFVYLLSVESSKEWFHILNI